MKREAILSLGLAAMFGPAVMAQTMNEWNDPAVIQINREKLKTPGLPNFTEEQIDTIQNLIKEEVDLNSEDLEMLHAKG